MVRINGQAVNQCMDPNRLQMVLAGNVPKGEFDSAISHLDECETCRMEAQRLDLKWDAVEWFDQDEDSAIESIRNETACQVAIGRLIRRSKSVQQSQPPIENLGTYRLLELVGSGGMGAVFRAEHQRLKRQCAIKLLPPDRVAQQGWLDRFNREMTTVASLEHPGIVRATDAGHDSGWHYLVMEYLDGMDLGCIASRLRRLSVEDACEIIRQAAIALSYIHDCGLVHRDIKPSNLMLTRDGVVKLLDLGLVLDGDDPLTSDERLTTVGHVMGTMPYMAPEQLTDSRDVRPQSDIYSLGATLYRLIAGRPPHLGSKGLAAHVLEITGQDAKPLDAVREDVDRDVVSLVASMLSRNPKKRPGSANEVAERLAELGNGHRLKRLVRQAESEEPKNEIRSGLLPAIPVAAGANVKHPRKRWLIGLALAGVFLLAGFLIKVETDRGLLVVHSQVSGLTVAIKKNGKTVDKLEIESKESRIRLRKGEYEIEIEGGGTALQLSEEVVTIGRNETREVVVESRPVVQPSAIFNQSSSHDEDPAAKSESGGDPSADYAYDEEYVGPVPARSGLMMGGIGSAMQGPTNPTGILVDGQTLDRWLAIVQEAGDSEELGRAMISSVKGLDRLREGDALVDQTIKTILFRARDFGGLYRKMPPIIGVDTKDPTVANKYFMWYFDQVFAEPTIDQWYLNMANELLAGNSSSRAAIVTSFHQFQVQKRITSGMYGGFEAGREKKFLTRRLLRGLVGLSDSKTWQGLAEDEQAAAATLARQCAIYVVRDHGIRASAIPDLIDVVKAIPKPKQSKLEFDWLREVEPSPRGSAYQEGGLRRADMGMGMEMGGMDMGMDMGMGEAVAPEGAAGKMKGR